MEPALKRRVEAAIEEATGAAAAIVHLEVASGGSISDARRLRLADGRRFFLKTQRAPFQPGLFEAEAAGLSALRGAGILPVPAEVAVMPDFLLLEQVEIRGPGPDFFAVFGRALARQHRQARAELFGFERDNFLGASPQPNGWLASWTSFWRERRLGHQLELLRRHGIEDRELQKLGDRLLVRLPEWLDEVADTPSLLHGDLWAGNFLSTEAGPLLIDPAVHYGHREAELAMTRLFGGFPAEFYRSYEEEWPLPPGAEERGAVYELYHLLNHYNLFGAAYRAPCLAILRRLV